MSILARQRTINTMTLVGATRGFIMRPFVWTAALHGLWAGLAATALFALLVVGLREGVPELGLAGPGALTLGIACGIVALGVAVSLLFTVAGVAAVLRKESGITQI
jgi:cell division transport system permease protein